ncbi:MAG: EamA family transporter [Patescibacteria group bacterium]|jgi:drug/metabolite transporter (DMT)-like permease
MSLGFLLSLAAGFVWSIGNIIDKANASRFIKNPIFLASISVCYELVVGVIVIALVPADIHGLDWFWLISSGACYMTATLLYFFAIQREEPSRVVPLYAFTIVFLSLQSAIFLGEIFSIQTYLGIAMIAIASLALLVRQNVFDAFRSKAFGLMIGGTFLYSLSYIINKYLLIHYSYWQVFGYVKLFIGCTGILFLLFFIKELRKTFRRIQKRYIGLSAISETFNIAGSLLFVAASSVWFVTLVETVVSVQYIFIFIWGILLASLFPRFRLEVVNKRIIIQKVLSIAAIIIGIYLIY